MNQSSRSLCWTHSVPPTSKMAFTNTVNLKRSRSNSRAFWPWQPNKLPRLEEFPYDGPASRQSMDSTSTTRCQHQNAGHLKAKFKKGSSHFKTLLGLGSRQSHTYNDRDGATLTTTDTHGSQNSSRTAAATTLKPLKLNLTGAHACNGQRDFVGDLQSTLEYLSAPALEAFPSHICASSLYKSQPTPGLTHRLSHRIQDVFSVYPTVVHRSDLRSRPSVHSIRQIGSKDGLLERSTPSTIGTYTGSSSPPGTARKSTAPTSDAMTISTSSVKHNGSLSPVDATRAIPLFDRETEYHRLSPISEATVMNIPSIVTAEATANAKIFFETHFNSIFNGDSPRSVRRLKLEDKLEVLGLPLDLRRRARKAWIRHETERLRQERTLKATTNDRNAPKGGSIAGYEVVRVLGKGSFGVVRLVRETATTKDAEDSRAVTPRLSLSAKSSRLDLASLKATAKEAFAPLSARKSDLSKTQSQVYAMKVIRKSDMILNSQEGHLRAERDFLVASEGCLWIIPLVASFQDSRHLYLVMDFCIGGDFLGLLIRKNTLSEDVTRWYIAEMILGVEEAHRLKWIHRDVKPDNFLIGADGHLKISDFGLAFDGEWVHDQQYYHKHRHSLLEKLGIGVEGDIQDREEAEVSKTIGGIFGTSSWQQAKKETAKTKDQEGPAQGEAVLDWQNRERRRKLARSVVGTSQYMAPEVIRGDMYDGRCDWWSVGIILYECLYGYTPFACDNRQDTKLRILKHRSTLEFPDGPQGREPISYDAIDLMLRILQEKEKRLCSRRYQLNDFTRKMTNGRSARVHADKTSKDYSGHFVYADDAEDIKAHSFFRGLTWDDLHLRKPPFVPRVKSWEDTKYFDEDDVASISDISESSESELQDRTPHEARHDAKNANPTVIGESGPGFHQHQHEDQKIVPSNGLSAKKIDEIMTATETQKDKDGRTTNPLLMPVLPSLPQQLDGEVSVKNQPPTTTYEELKKPHKRKEKKRPRDKILRDAECGKTALEMRKLGAFLGYGYRRARGVDEAIRGALNEVGNGVENEVL